MPQFPGISVRARAAFVGFALLAANAAHAFEAKGSVEQVYVTGLTPGASVSLLDPGGNLIELFDVNGFATPNPRTANELGGTLFRNLPPGEGYTVISEGVTSAPLTVHDQSSAPWDPSIYEQEMTSNGYGYITMRDGITLAYTVHPPTNPATLGTKNPITDSELPNLFPAPDHLPPYPTLIEYSGYSNAKPDGPQSGLAVLANAMGFAVVNVNMRGMGCSGGAFDFFEPLQSLDGYDIIETVARQPWVAHGHVGMMGISYGGISQLFAAQTQPPSLAAISPLSVLDSTATTLYPGGILNHGFSVEWGKARFRDATQGQGWAHERIANGDTVCADNQTLHPEALDLLDKIAKNDFYIPEAADPLAPISFVDKINVPAFVVCQWQDEQTGGHCPELARRMTGTDKKWFTFTNGTHIDSLAPDTYNRWFDFLQLYVAKRPPLVNSPEMRATAPAVYAVAYGIPSDTSFVPDPEFAAPVTLPVDPIQLLPDYGLALDAFEALPPIRVLFENGAGRSPLLDATPGNPYPTFEASFDQYPPANIVAREWYFGPDGTLTDDLPDQLGADQFTADALALPKTNYTGGTGTGSLWGNAVRWQWDWQHNPEGTALSYVSEPLAEDVVVVGAGAVYAQLRSSTPDVDLQATVSEVRADGKETFVQNGYLRASIRKLSSDENNMFKRLSEVLDPILSFFESDVEAMPVGQYTDVAIPMYHQGHVYRAGSRIRLTIAAPNGAQPIWAFDETQPANPDGSPATAEVAVSWSPTQPAKLVLPVVPGLAAPAGSAYPACPGLRNQPCRDYVPLANQSALPDADADGVADANDACPATPAGESVDPQGCADSQKDADGDGVSDAADQCPATAPNTAVDPRGCPAASGNLSVTLSVTADDTDVSDGPVTVTLSAQPSDAIGDVTYAYYFGDGSDPVQTSATSVDHVYTQAGTYTLTVAAVDENQNSASDQQTLTLTTSVNVEDPDQPLMADLGLLFMPESQVAPVTVNFDASGSTPQGNLIYRFDFGDGAQQQGTNPFAQRVYGLAGSYTVTLTVWEADDPNTTETTSQTFEVLAVQQTTATLSVSPSQTQVGQTVTFDASASVVVAPDEVEAYVFAFGDGETERRAVADAGPNYDPAVATYAYPAAGTYLPTVTLELAGGGTKSAQAQVRVQPVGAGGPGQPGDPIAAPPRSGSGATAPTLLLALAAILGLRRRRHG